MESWSYSVIGLCLLLLAVLIRNEWRRQDKSNRLLRLTASLLAVVSFALLALPVTRNRKTAISERPEAIILTEGFDRDSVEAFIRQSKNAPVFSTGTRLGADAKRYNARFVSTAEWAAIKQTFSNIHVFGYGLEEDELQALSASSMVFHSSKPPDGVSTVHWPDKIKSGGALEIWGRYQNTSSAGVRLVLTGFERSLDTAFIPAKKHGYFKLFARPKVAGRAIYQVVALSGKDTLGAEPVPFETEALDTPKILMLSASPDFEAKFLKSWLSQNGYAVTSRTAISSGKYEKAFLNTPQVSFNAITGSVLNNFDVAIADARALAALARSELAAIEAQVSQKGLGLIVRGDSIAKNAFYSTPFPVVRGGEANRKALHLLLPGRSQPVLLPAEEPAFIRQQAGTQLLIAHNQSDGVASNSMHGAGRLVYTTLNTTYTWMLSGAKDAYQIFWSHLISKAAVGKAVDARWSVWPGIPYVDKPVRLTYAGNNPDMPQVQTGGAFVSLIQNPDLPFRWQGACWPQYAGWQVQSAERDTAWWYAYGPENWKTAAAFEKLNRTLQAGFFAKISGNEAVKAGMEKVPVNKVYFFILFMLSAGFLWAEKKLWK